MVYFIQDHDKPYALERSQRTDGRQLDLSLLCNDLFTLGFPDNGLKVNSDRDCHRLWSRTWVRVTTVFYWMPHFFSILEF